LLDEVLGDLRAVNAGGEEAGGHQRLRIVRLVFVAGDLPFHEGIKRYVLVERLDDEIAIMKGVRPVVIMLVAAALSEAGDVEPVPSPAFAVVRVLEQAVDQPGIRFRRSVIDERLDFPRRGRQTDQVETNTA